MRYLIIIKKYKFNYLCYDQMEVILKRGMDNEKKKRKKKQSH